MVDLDFDLVSLMADRIPFDVKDIQTFLVVRLKRFGLIGWQTKITRSPQTSSDS